MTKVQAIEKARNLMELLDSLPDDIDIITAEIRDYLDPMFVQVRSGVESIARALNSSIETRIPNEYIYKEIHTRNCEFIQLERAGGESR